MFFIRSWTCNLLQSCCKKCVFDRMTIFNRITQSYYCSRTFLDHAHFIFPCMTFAPPLQDKKKKTACADQHARACTSRLYHQHVCIIIKSFEEAFPFPASRHFIDLEEKCMCLARDTPASRSACRSPSLSLVYLCHFSLKTLLQELNYLMKKMPESLKTYLRII